MFIGTVTSCTRKNDNAEIDNESTVINVTESGLSPNVELSFELPNHRTIYITFRISDLLRAIEEKNN